MAPIDIMALMEEIETGVPAEPCSIPADLDPPPAQKPRPRRGRKAQEVKKAYAAAIAREVRDAPDMASAVGIFIREYREGLLQSVADLSLNDLVFDQNPYLFFCRGVTQPERFVEESIQAKLSSSEQTRFGLVMEAILTEFAMRSPETHAEPGADEEYDLDMTRPYPPSKNGGCRIIVDIKSSKKTLNGKSRRRLAQKFNQIRKNTQKKGSYDRVLTMVGLIYGREGFTEAVDHVDVEIAGQTFWYFITKRRNAYIEILDMLADEGFGAKLTAKVLETKERLLSEFILKYRDPSGKVDYAALVKDQGENLPDEADFPHTMKQIMGMGR